MTTRKRKESHTKSQKGYISAIWGADHHRPISTKIGKVEGAHNIIILSNFGLNILGVSDLQGVKISIVLLTSAAITVQPVIEDDCIRLWSGIELKASEKITTLKLINEDFAHAGVRKYAGASITFLKQYRSCKIVEYLP